MRFKLVLIFSLAPLFAFGSMQDDACKAKEINRTKMNIIAANIANLNTTRTPEGGPYRRKELVCNGQTCDITESSSFAIKYEPEHPDSDKSGFVVYPDIDVTHEMESMLRASRKYEEAASRCN